MKPCFFEQISEDRAVVARAVVARSTLNQVLIQVAKHEELVLREIATESESISRLNGERFKECNTGSAWMFTPRATYPRKHVSKNGEWLGSVLIRTAAVRFSSDVASGNNEYCDQIGTHRYSC